MENFLPKNRVMLVLGFVLVCLFALGYIIFIKIPYSEKNPNLNLKISPTNSISAPYFNPPKTTTKEVSVTGRIVRLDEREAAELKASHKVLGQGGVVLILAKTDDDKLKQQEGNTVTLVGTIPYNLTVKDTTVMEVQYISFK